MFKKWWLNFIGKVRHLLATWGIKKVEKPEMSIIDNPWLLPNSSSSGSVEIVEANTWIEGPIKCQEHCWHKAKQNMKHISSIQLGSGDEHGDYYCCRCTHLLCHIGRKSTMFDGHPLPKYHQKSK